MPPALSTNLSFLTPCRPQTSPEPAGAAAAAASPSEGAASAAAGASSSDVTSERCLPGVVMAAGGTFGTLCRLAELRDAAITAGARAILHLVPTEPAVSDALETLCAPPDRPPAGAEPAETVRQMLGGGQNPATGLRLVYNLEVGTAGRDGTGGGVLEKPGISEVVGWSRKLSVIDLCTLGLWSMLYRGLWSAVVFYGWEQQQRKISGIPWGLESVQESAQENTC